MQGIFVMDLLESHLNLLYFCIKQSKNYPKSWIMCEIFVVFYFLLR